MISTLLFIAVVIVGVILIFWAIDSEAATFSSTPIPATTLRLIGLLKIIVVLIAFVVVLQRLGYV
jgi:hypothetical protein